MMIGAPSSARSLAQSFSVPLRVMSILPQNCGERHHFGLSEDTPKGGARQAGPEIIRGSPPTLLKF
jgi:hypothetical protein